MHRTKTSEETLALAATQPAPPTASVDQAVPTAIARVVDRALAFRKADRWPSARAMRDALIRAGCFVWGCDESQHLDDPEDTDEEKTEPGSPDQMTLPSDAAPPMLVRREECAREAPTLRIQSPPGDTASSSQSEGRQRRRHIISRVVCAIGIAIAVAVIATVPTASKQRTQPVSEHSSTGPPVGASTR